MGRKLVVIGELTEKERIKEHIRRILANPRIMKILFGAGDRAILEVKGEKLTAYNCDLEEVGK